MRIQSQGDATSSLIVRIDGEIHEVEFSDTNLDRVQADVGEHLVESDRYRIDEYQSGEDS